MALKPSSALLAAMIAIAAPAFAQDTPTTDAPAAPATDPIAGTTGTLPPAADTPTDTDPATEAATDAGTAVTEIETTDGDAAAATDAAAEPATDSAEGAAGGSEMPAAAETVPTDAEAPADAAATDAPPASPTDAPATETGAAAGASETGAGTGTAAAGGAAAAAPDPNAEPQVGAYYVKSTHNDWLIRCIKAAEGVDPCELYQLMRDDSGNSVAEVTLIPLEGGEVAAGATVVVPLETDLTFGLNFQVDQGPGRVYPFNFCAPVGCVARVGFPNADLNALKRGNVANVALLPFGGNPENPVQLQLSLSGFTAGLDELQSLAVAEPGGDAGAQGSDSADTPAADAAANAEAEPTADGADSATPGDAPAESEPAETATEETAPAN